MLIYNEKIAALDSLIDELICEIKTSDIFNQLKIANHIFLSDIALQNAIKEFEIKRDFFLEQEEYMKYRPELKDIKLELIQCKRKLDLNPKTIDLKLSENDFQELLDNVVEKITDCFSDNIQIDSSHPIHHFKKGGNHHGKCNVN